MEPLFSYDYETQASLEPGKVSSDIDVIFLKIYNKEHIYIHRVPHTHTRWSGLLHISSHLTLTITTKGWHSYVYFLEMKQQ